MPCSSMRRAFGIFLFLASVLSLPAETVSARSLRIPNARTAAIGGTHAALGDDLTTLTNNPAGLYDVESRLHVAELTFGLSGPIFSLANIVLRGVAGEDTDALLSDPAVADIFKSVYVGAAVIGPLSFGYVGKGLGFSIISAAGLDLASAGSTNYAVSAWERTALYGGYAFRVHLPERTRAALDIGVNLKTFIEGKTSFYRTLLEIPDLFSDAAGAFLDNPFSLTTGIGLDLGARYTYRDVLTVGLVGRDVFTPTTRSDYASLDAFLSNQPPAPPVDGRVPFDLSLGLMYRPRLGSLEWYLQDFKMFIDYRDMLDFWTHPDSTINPLLKIGLGAEITVLQVLQIRAGINEGLFAWGFGLDYGAVRFHFAMFGSEMSSEPGLRPVFNLLMGFEIRL